jgi:hypothetical protein
VVGWIHRCKTHRHKALRTTPALGCVVTEPLEENRNMQTHRVTCSFLFPGCPTTWLSVQNSTQTSRKRQGSAHKGGEAAPHLEHFLRDHTLPGLGHTELSIGVEQNFDDGRGWRTGPQHLERSGYTCCWVTKFEIQVEKSVGDVWIPCLLLPRCVTS